MDSVPKVGAKENQPWICTDVAITSIVGLHTSSIRKTRREIGSIRQMVVLDVCPINVTIRVIKPNTDNMDTRCVHGILARASRAVIAQRPRLWMHPESRTRVVQPDVVVIKTNV